MLRWIVEFKNILWLVYLAISYNYWYDVWYFHTTIWINSPPPSFLLFISVYLCVCVSVCLSVCLSACVALFISLSLSFHLFSSHHLTLLSSYPPVFLSISLIGGDDMRQDAIMQQVFQYVNHTFECDDEVGEKGASVKKGKLNYLIMCRHKPFCCRERNWNSVLKKLF